MTGSRKKLIRRGANLALAGGFALALWLPLADGWLGLDHTPELTENRSKAPRPRAGVAPTRWSDYPEAYEAYFSDSFGLRNRLIRWHAAATAGGLGVSPDPEKVLIGREGWLYLSEDHALESFRAETPFSEGELARWRDLLVERRDWLAGRGIRFLLIIAPNKHTIYPEFLPTSIRRVGERTRLDQFVEYLAEHSDLAVIDPRAGLIEAKARGRNYAYTDTHWNGLGAHVAYAQAMDRVGDWFPDIKPLGLDEMEIETIELPGQILAEMVGMPERFRDEHISVLPAKPRAIPADPLLGPAESHIGSGAPYATRVDDPSLPRLLMLRDSFSILLIPLIAEHFSDALYLWQGNLGPSHIEHQRPDIVIQQITERYFEIPPESFPDTVEEAGDLYLRAANSELDSTEVKSVGLVKFIKRGRQLEMRTGPDEPRARLRLAARPGRHELTARLVTGGDPASIGRVRISVEDPPGERRVVWSLDMTFGHTARLATRFETISPEASWMIDYAPASDAAQAAAPPVTFEGMLFQTWLEESGAP